YFTSKETKIGVIRYQESKGKSLFQLAGGYGEVVKIILKSKGMVFSIIIAALTWIVGMINNTFWQIITNQKLHVPESVLPLFMVLRSILAIIFLFFVIPRLLKGILKKPLLLGFAAFFIGQTLLILVPSEGMLRYPLLILSLVFDGFGLAALTMLCESIISLHVNPNERARIMAVRLMFVLIVTAPFGWIGGMLSDVSKNLPFILNMVILVIGVVIILIYYRRENDHSAEHT
ncbi:MAG: MFS transporter, partial [Treponema sp.]|nr:MFS transporter [Treponema sp.]